MSEHYIHILNTYKYYSSQTIQNYPSIPLNIFIEFIETTNIIDNKSLKMSDINLKFIACNSTIKLKKNLRNPEKNIIRY